MYVCGCRVQGGGECVYIATFVSCVTLQNIQYLISLQPHWQCPHYVQCSMGQAALASVQGTQCPCVLSATIVFLVTFRALVRAAAFTTGVWKCVALNNRLETSSRSTVLSSTGTLPWARPLWKEKTTKSGWPQGMTWLQPQTVIHALHTCKPAQLAWNGVCM